MCDSGTMITGAETVLYSFCSQTGCADGANPYGTLIDVKGKLYGTTGAGGDAGKGTAFSIDPSTGAVAHVRAHVGVALAVARGGVWTVTRDGILRRLADA